MTCVQTFSYSGSLKPEALSCNRKESEVPLFRSSSERWIEEKQLGSVVMPILSIPFLGFLVVSRLYYNPKLHSSNESLYIPHNIGFSLLGILAPAVVVVVAVVVSRFRKETSSCRPYCRGNTHAIRTSTDSWSKRSMSSSSSSNRSSASSIRR